MKECVILRKESQRIYKKHAMLIMAHTQFDILEKLMQQLDHGRNVCVVR